jgi:hypothetical protein
MKPKHPLRQPFIDFLVAHNCLIKYAINKSKNPPDPKDWISKAFLWHRTAEGAVYWDDIDFEWQKVIRNDPKA